LSVDDYDKIIHKNKVFCKVCQKNVVAKKDI
jgi:hypothetical protein